MTRSAAFRLDSLVCGVDLAFLLPPPLLPSSGGSRLWLGICLEGTVYTRSFSSEAICPSPSILLMELLRSLTKLISFKICCLMLVQKRGFYLKEINLMFVLFPSTRRK